MFYTFNQNNSGGGFDYDPELGITHHVIVEGDNLQDILDTAEKIGIYFNGVDKEIDCECCGDRWYEPFDSDLKPNPLIYGEDPNEYVKNNSNFLFLDETPIPIFIHYKNGIHPVAIQPKKKKHKRK